MALFQGWLAFARPSLAKFRAPLRGAFSRWTSSGQIRKQNHATSEYGDNLPAEHPLLQLLPAAE